MSHGPKRLLSGLVVGSSVATMLALTSATALAGGPPVPSDFDGDGFADLAIGAPNDDVKGIKGAGVVIVLYGSSGGLGAERSQVWHQGKLPLIEGESVKLEAGDHFGAALAVGDFNGDDISDLAVGVPGEDLTGIHDDPHVFHSDAGAVEVIYGTGTGLSTTGATGLRPANLRDAAQAGFALAPVDLWAGLSFNGSDGISDLAVGMPGVNGVEVHASSLSGVGNSMSLIQGPGGMGVGKVGRTGAALAAGDLDDDPVDELVIGAPDVPRDGHPEAGQVMIHSASFGDESIDEGDVVGDETQLGAHFGSSLAVADVSGDGFGEIYVGAPDHDVSVSGPAVLDAGLVIVVLGASGGPSIAAAVAEGTGNIPDTIEAGDHLGSSLAVADLGNGDSPDVVMGAPGEEVGGHVGAGKVFVVYGGSDVTQTWHQDRPGIAGTAAAGDGFGSTLFAGNFGHGGRADLAIGVPGDTVGAATRAGAVNVLYGSASGATSADSQRWTQDSAGVGEDAQKNDRFGAAVR